MALQETVDLLFLDERRLVSRVLRHWSEMATGQRFPKRREIDPWLLGEDWTSCVLIHIEADLERSSLIAVGENLVPHGTRDLVGKPVSSLPAGSLLALMLSSLSRAVSSGLPVTVGGAATLDGIPIVYRSVLLPLSENGAYVDSVLGAANFRKLAVGEATGVS